MSKATSPRARRDITPRAGLWAGLVVLACGAWVWSAVLEQPRRQSLRYACWYWHHPFHLMRDERQRLREAGIERLYVYAGTLVARAGGLRLIRKQQWGSAAPGELYAVIRVHPQANKALFTAGAADSAALLLRAVPYLRTVAGIQWDADIPTADLGDYARFLRRFRRQIAPGQRLSVTAVPDWLRGRDYAAVCDAVDEVAPQFYGNQWPEPGQRPTVLWETRNLLAAVRRSVKGRARVWIGLPAYGRCMVMDARGQPIGVRHDLDPDQLLDDPAWEVQTAGTRWERWEDSSRPVPVEDTLALRCWDNAAAGPMEASAGTRLWFQWPRADGLRAALAAIRAAVPPGVEGVCFFRWPAPEEPLAGPASMMGAVTAAREPPAGSGRQVTVRIRREGRTVRVSVWNAGVDALLPEGGIRLEVAPPRGAEVLADGPVAWQRGNEPASALRGDRAVFTQALLRSGHRWEVCRVENCPGPVQARVRWKGSDGRWLAQRVCEPGRDVEATRGSGGAR